MKRWQCCFFWGTLGFAVASRGVEVNAGEPREHMPAIRTLVGACDRDGEAPMRRSYTARAYPYGFFGAIGGPQASRHYGHQNAYRQWTWR